MNNISDGEKVVIGLVFVLLLLFFMMYGFVFSSLFSIFVTNAQLRFDIVRVMINGFSVVASSGLTLALVYLYYKMSKINEGQRGIAERQIRLEEAQNRPYLFFEDIRIKNDRVILKIANEGTGLAKNFHLRCDASLSPSEHDFSSDTKYIRDIFKDERQGFELSAFEVPLLGPDKMRKSTQMRGTEILKEEDNSSWYFPQFDLGWMSSETVSGGGVTSKSFSDIMTTLENNIGNKNICIQITLIYSDITGSLYADIVESMVVEIDSNQFIQQAIDHQDPRRGCGIDTETILEDVDKEKINSIY